MSLIRAHSRPAKQLRKIELIPSYYDYAEGSCLVKFGRTHVLCVASIDNSAPPHLRNSGRGWVTAEYGMLPRCSADRIRREKSGGSGRTHEIQRLIGRALRSITNMHGWGERSITLDCDVLQADGGTRTASITGAFVALALAFRFLKKTEKIDPNLKFPLSDFVSAVSVGIVDGHPVLDLDYPEDSRAQADMNMVMTAQGELIEVQGTAEEKPFTRKEFDEMLGLAEKGCQELCTLQKEVLGDLTW